MEFQWFFTKDTPQQIKTFLKEQGVSKGLLAKIKFQGGAITVNQQQQNVLHKLELGDDLRIVIPDEEGHETVVPWEQPLDILFEDAHFLAINKPAGVASIPSQYHPFETVANQVKAYYLARGYRDQVVHVVTRLDRDTSGVMLFARHGFAHARIDQQLRQKKVIKIYHALVSGDLDVLVDHETIIRPIGRDYTSLLKRMVTEEGQYAETEYWLQQVTPQMALVKIQLHTGRTHQIRVHFESLGCPLLGDEMYHGALGMGIERQALHCSNLSFIHPFTHEEIQITAPLAGDMQCLIE